MSKVQTLLDRATKSGCILNINSLGRIKFLEHFHLKKAPLRYLTGNLLNGIAVGNSGGITTKFILHVPFLIPPVVPVVYISHFRNSHHFFYLQFETRKCAGKQYASKLPL